MAKQKLTRKTCERMILAYCKKIQKLYKKYHPNGDYLTIAICDNNIHANNAYWEDADREKPLDFYFIDGEMRSVTQ